METQAARASIDQLVHWVEAHKFQAYDPGDGELSYLRHATLGNHFLSRLLTAAVLRTPYNIRPLIGIRPHTSTKGMGYMGWGYTKMFAATGDQRYRVQAEHCYEWLMEHRSPGFEHFAWGNNFAFSTRSGTIARYTPTIVWSSLIGYSFLEAYEVLGNPRYLEVAASVAEFVKTLPREQTDRGICLSYVPDVQSSIHNSNMLGAGLLARVASYTQDGEAKQIARQAMLYSCTHQNPDGAWFYGVDPKYHWIDNFHTGYNLDCLKRYIDSTGDNEFDRHLEAGLQYFKKTFFGADGRPTYYHNQPGPVDIQCASQAVDTLAYFSANDPSCLELSQKVARWTIANMQDADGHFYYRDLGWKKIKTPMFHWGQGTMFKALAHLLSKLQAEAPRRSAPVLEIQNQR